MLKVSLIIPVYMVEDYLEECLDSVLNQTLENIEVLCINDASPDSSKQILDKYAEKDSRVHIINHEENQGLSAARNTGLRIARGEYIYFLDSDDRLERKALEILSKSADEYKSEILAFDAIVFKDKSFQDTNFYSSDDFNYKRQDLIPAGRTYAGKEFLHLLLQNGAYKSSACLSIIKRDFLISNNISFYPGILHEDELFTISMYLIAERIAYLPELFLQRRLRSDSIQNTSNANKKIKSLLFISKQLSVLAKKEESSVKADIWKHIFVLLKVVVELKATIADKKELWTINILMLWTNTWWRYNYHLCSKRVRRKARKIISGYRIKVSGDDNIRKFSRIIDSLDNSSKWSEIEKESFEIVSRIRKTYLNSEQSLLYTDYGAIDPSKIITTNKSASGTYVHRKLSDICKIASTPEKWGILLYKIITEFKPAICLELGTNIGISAAYQLLALQNNRKGKLITIEGAPELARIAEETLSSTNYQEYEIVIGKFSEVLSETLQRCDSIDLVFIDGHHDKKATIEYFNLIYPSLSYSSIVIFDDINWDNGMAEAWKDISTDKRINNSIDIVKWGVCFIKKENPKPIANSIFHISI